MQKESRAAGNFSLGDIKAQALMLNTETVNREGKKPQVACEMLYSKGKVRYLNMSKLCVRH